MSAFIPIAILVVIMMSSGGSNSTSRGNVMSPAKGGSRNHLVKSFRKPSFKVPNVSINPRTFNATKEYQAIFQYITRKFKKVTAQDAEKIARYLVEYGKKHNIDPKFAAAVMARESGYNRLAISKTGAKGLGQIKDFNFKSLDIKDPYDIKQNVNGTTKYLSKMVGRWKTKSTDPASMALASYFIGPNALARQNGKVNAHTTTYVNDIMGYYDDIKSVRRRVSPN
ncbi:transglycosylase SLT domain-containing protein [bacterium]|nr:transglycosylase SLT domain-containing protein [bacterium]